MARLLAILTLILSIALFPPAALALISNNAVPGDVTYPIKRGLEAVILKVASTHPTTKAWFSLERSGRRFEESKILLTAGKNEAEKSLEELVIQTQEVSNEIAKVQDPVKKQELKEKLSQQIKKYDEGLEKVKQEIAQTSQPAEQSAPRPTSTIQVTSSANPTPTPTPPTPAATTTPGATASPRPTATPGPSATPRPTVHPTVSPTIRPSPSPILYVTPYTTPYPTPTNLSSCDAILNQIERAQCRLQFIQIGLGVPTTAPEEPHRRGRNQDRDSGRDERRENERRGDERENERDNSGRNPDRENNGNRRQDRDR